MDSGKGVDSGRAVPHGGPGMVMFHREYPPQVCPGKGKPCGKTFKPNTANGKYCEECRKKA